ncbi:MAG: polysaccharide deacetylase family protein [Terriglobia bacterium]
MKTLLICHDGARLDQQAMPRWLASFSNLVGIVVIQEPHQRLWKRIRREIKRVGWFRFLDVLALRLYYKFFLGRTDRQWELQKVRELCSLYPETSSQTPTLFTPSPNSPEAEDFIRKAAPDIMIARCKTLLKKRVFSTPTIGTFVMHPGICPEYRNAHGCFWALAKDDVSKVGMTLLRIDEGIDTGPTFGYFTAEFDEVSESHIVIQHRVTYDNLDSIKNKLIEINEGIAQPLHTTGRPSATWGQPWLSAYVKWKFHAKRRASSRATALLYHDVIHPGDYASSGFLMPGANRYKLEIDEFKRHLASISKASAGAPSTVLEFLRHPGNAHPLFITFDDGGGSALTTTESLLGQYGWKGHFFVTTDYINRPGFLTDEQILLLRQKGHVIGTHSCSHPAKISACDPEALLKEWGNSIGVLSSLLGEEVITASVPGGFYSRRVAETAAACGIRALFTSEPTTRAWKVNGCWVFGRFGLVHGSPPSQAASIAAGRVAVRFNQFVAWNFKKYAKVVGGRAYTTLRERLVR